MKKRISITLVIAMLLAMLSYTTSSALVYYPLDEIGECSVNEDYNQPMTLYYSVDGEKYPLSYYYDEEEFEYIVDFFSDKNLVNTGKTFNTLGDSTIADFDGNFNFHTENHETCLVYFNESEVFFIKRGMESDENDKRGSYAKQAMFTYKNESIYEEFEQFLLKEVDEYIEEKAIEEYEEQKQREEEIKNQQQGIENDTEKVYIEDFRVIYKAEFDSTDIDFFDVVGNNASWGMCSYKVIGENERTVTPFTWSELSNGIGWYYISDRLPSDNKVSLGLEYVLVIDNNENYAYYVPTQEAPDCIFELDVTDDLKVSGVSYTAYEDGKLWQTGQLDMSTYVETGTLPKEYFSPNNNIKAEEEVKKELSQDELLKLIPSHIEKAFTEKCPEDEDPDNIRYDVYMYVLTEEKQFSSSKKLKDNSTKAALMKQWLTIYNLAASDCSIVDEKEFNEKVTKNKSNINKYAKIRVKGAVSSDFELELYNEYVKLTLGQFNDEKTQYIYLKIDNPDEVLDCLLDIDAYEYDVLETKIVLDKLDLKNKTLDSKPLKVVETFSFAVNVDESAYHSIYKTLANKGEKINCLLTHIMVNQDGGEKSYFIIELKGSKGEKSYFSSYSSTLEYGNCEIYFSQRNIYENNQLKTIKNYNDNSPWLLEFYGVPENDEVKAVVLRYEFKDSLASIDGNTDANYGNTVCYDYDYKFLLDDYEWEKNRNICYMITFDEEEEWMDRNEAYHKRKALGIKENTFKVNALAQVPLNIDKETAPDWYKDLGRNVNLMILSVTEEGKFARNTFLVLRFRGAAGEIWFDPWNINGIDFPEEEYEFIWKSTVAFDSTKYDEDHTVEEKMSGKAFCSGGRDSVLEGIELYIGDETYKFNINDLNVIGCDVFTRDMVYRSISYYKKAYWDELDEYMSSMKYGNVYHY